MRLGSPATFECPKDKRTLHHWSRLMMGNIMTKEAWNTSSARQARCMKCGLVVKGADARDIFIQR